MDAKLSHYFTDSDYDFGFRHRTVYIYNENSELHYHDFFEIFLVLSDDVVHIINGVKEAIPRGTLVFIRKNDVHCFEYSTSREPSFVNLIFKEEVTRKLFEYLSDDFQLGDLLTQLNPPSLLVNESDIAWILKQLELLNSTPATDFQQLKYQSRIFLFELFTRYFYKTLSGNEQRKDNMPGWLYELDKEMQKFENFSQESHHMVKMSGKNREYLGRTIKKYYGKTLTEYINDLRLNYWANVLVTSDAPILDICYECGFQNVSWAYTLFKNKYGMSPLKYRKTAKKAW